MHTLVQKALHIELASQGEIVTIFSAAVLWTERVMSCVPFEATASEETSKHQRRKKNEKKKNTENIRIIFSTTPKY